jgi:hypothetical protein
LNTGAVGFSNPSSTAGSATYRWNDLNSDHFVQSNEVNLNQFISAAGGFNPASPTAVTSANVIDPNLKAPITQSIVAGIDRELMANLALQFNYSYTRTSELFGNFANNITPRVGVGLADYVQNAPLTGTLPDGTTYSIPNFTPNAAAVAAGGSGFLLTNVPGYTTDYNGLELGIVKRLSNKWMARAGFSFNSAREHFSDAASQIDLNGNPTRTVTEPLVDGGQFAPQSGGSGAGTIYINAKWQFNANAMYQAPYGIEVSGNVFGRQGYPLPYVRQATFGNDARLQVLVSPEIDTFRYPNLWNTDLRVAREFKFQRLKVRGILDAFNVFNGNTALVRVNNVTPLAGGALPANVNQLAQNLSPRIFRVGLVVGF